MHTDQRTIYIFLKVLINNEKGHTESFQLKKLLKSASKLKNFIATSHSEELEAAMFYSLGIGFYSHFEVLARRGQTTPQRAY